jgi:hypothetical protein
MKLSGRVAVIALAANVVLIASGTGVLGAPRKAHVVVLGVVRKVSYSKAGDPAGAAPGEDTLKIRALIVDNALKEWTTGDAHDVTDRSFVVRRALKLNDALPGDKSPSGEISAPADKADPKIDEQDKPGQAGKSASQEKAGPAEKPGQWVWQRGPWLMVDRATGHVTPLKLPDYDPGVSQASWFRDYAAYCGVTPSGKSLYAVVAQVAARKPVLAKKLAPFDANGQAGPACTPPEWQREPLRVTFHPVGRDQASFDIVPGSAVLVEDSSDEAVAPATAQQAKPN